MRKDEKYTYTTYGTAAYTYLDGRPLSDADLEKVQKRTKKALKRSMKQIPID